MKTFLKENPTIAFGLGLPLLLVLVFLLVSGLPTLLVAPPQYEVLYATEHYNYPNGVQISVVNDKVQVIYQGNLQNRQKPRIWRYNPQTGAVKEIGYTLPPGLMPPGKKQPTPEEAAKTTLINVPELDTLTVDSSSIAPDGYEFSVDRDRYSRGIFGGLFYSSRYRHEGVLTKDGRTIRLPNSADRYYRGNTRLIGWIIPS